MLMQVSEGTPRYSCGQGLWEYFGGVPNQHTIYLFISKSPEVKGQETRGKLKSKPHRPPQVCRW